MSRRRRSRLPRPIPIVQGDLGISKIGASRFDINDPYHLAVSLSWPAFAALLLATWLAINLVFAALYVASPGDLANARPGSFSDAFFFSIETLATVGYGVMAPASLYGHVVSAAEIVCGMVFTAIMTGLLFVRFSRPKAKLIYAQDAVITRYNGLPTLMVRLANGRMTIMTSASARLFVLIAERTTEGQYLRRVHDLPVLQSHLPLFVMPWTLMHVIDHASPLHGLDAEGLGRTEARLILTIEAHDRALASAVTDVHTWPAQSICIGMRYADAVDVDETGHATADLARISLLEPEAAAG